MSGCRGKEFAWPIEAVDTLRRMLAEGHLCAAVARQLSLDHGVAISRSMVIGKSRRLGVTCLVRRGQKQPAPPAPAPEEKRSSRDPEALRLFPAPASAVTLIHLRPRQCRFPVGEAGGLGQLFCAAACDESETYCAPCQAIAYDRSRPKRTPSAPSSGIRTPRAEADMVPLDRVFA